MRLVAVPMELHEANAFVANFHRHSDETRGHRFSIGCSDGEELAGVAITGRPQARMMHDGYTAEVLRCCVHPRFWSDGPKGKVPHPDAPAGAHAAAIESFLYAASWRAWRAMGGRKLITYTLKEESGASLRAAGFRIIAELPPRKGAAWANRPGRDWKPIYGQSKFRWELES